MRSYARRIKTTNNANGRELKSLTSYHDDGSVAAVGQITATGTNFTYYSERQDVPGVAGAYKIITTDALSNETGNYYSGDGQLYPKRVVTNFMLFTSFLS